VAEATTPPSDGGSGSLLRLILMLVLGGAVAFPYVSPSTPPRPSALTVAASAGPSSPAGKAPGEDDPKKDGLSLLGEFVGISIDPPSAKVDSSRMVAVREAFETNNVVVEFVIATMPDPIDSNARWLFDPMMAAIGSAAAASGYLLDRFYIPDWDPRDAGSDHVSSSRTVHERWPAVVLFRHDGFDPKTRRLLLVSLVPETPTSGIHQQAFKSAVTQIVEWYGGRPPGPIRVLGPNFSGSVPSLSIAIDRSAASYDIGFRVVSGGATNPRNRETIQPLANGRSTTFHATVLPDDFVTERTLQFLIDTDDSLKERGRLAFLVEENTTYGRELSQGPAPGDRASEPPKCQGTSAECAKSVLAHARQLPFPLHISRLRSAAEAQPRQTVASAGPRHLALPLDESGTVTDQIPSLTAKSTSASVELVIANILDTIDREHITTVGLLATDARDKLFLAEQIARRDATVRLFTIESDLFYLHQDYSAYTRGMIVASTYPLFNQNQHWVNRQGFQRQFPTTNAQGTYNAMLALLNYKENGDDLSSAVAPPELLDYVTPDVSGRWPALWISVVGQDAIWPLRWYDASGSTAIGYLQRISSPVIPPAIVAHASAWTDFVFLGLLVLVTLHLIAYQWRNELAERPSLSRSAAKYIIVGDFHRRTPYALLMFATLLVGYGYACCVFALFVAGVQRAEYTALRFGCIWITAGVSLGVLIWLLVILAGLSVDCLKGAWARIVASGSDSVARRARDWLPITSAVVLGSIAVKFGAAYLVHIASVPAMRVYYFERVTHMQNGVSPAPAIAFLLGALYLWSFANLRRLIAMPGSALEDRFLTLKELAPTELPGAIGDLREFIDGTVRALPALYVGVVVAACSVFAYVAFVHPLATPEVRDFTVAFRAAWLLVQLLILLAFAQTLYFWRVLRRSFKPFTGTPMIAAFDRLPPNLFGDRLSPQRPQIGDLRRAIRVGEQLRLAISRVGGPGSLGMSMAEHHDVEAALCWPNPAAPVPSTRWWVDSKEWWWLGQACSQLAPIVFRSWGTERQSALKNVDFDCKVEAITEPAQLWFLRAEEFLALQIMFLVRELLGRLVNICFFTIMGVLLMVGAQHSFPFQPRQELLGTVWLYVISAVAVVLWIFMQMERDPVLSAFSSNQAGKLRWDATLWSKVLVYGAIPIATIFAAQFPEIGTSIMSWLAPVQGVLR
jgi:hypothetical protein